MRFPKTEEIDFPPGASSASEGAVQTRQKTQDAEQKRTFSLEIPGS